MPLPLTETQIAVCRAMGVAPDDYARQLEKDQADKAAALQAQNGLSKEQLAVCRAMGIDPKDYLSTSAHAPQAVGVTACSMNYSPEVEAEVMALINRYTVKRHH